VDGPGVLFTVTTDDDVVGWPAASRGDRRQRVVTHQRTPRQFQAYEYGRARDFAGKIVAVDLKLHTEYARHCLSRRL